MESRTRARMSRTGRFHAAGAILACLFATALFVPQGAANEGVREAPLPSPEVSPFIAGATLKPPESEDFAPAGLRAEPRELTFRTRDAVGRVQILRNGERVPSNLITNVRALVGNSDYSRMFRFRVSEEEPGVLIIGGHPQVLEIGIYDVHFRVGGEETHVRVRAPLDGDPDSLQRQAEQRGMTVKELLREKGFTRPGERAEIRIHMPERFYEGQLMRLTLAHSPGTHFTWIINGETVLEGENASTLTHALTEPGTHTLRVEERSNGRLVAEWEGEFRVEAETPTPWTIRAGQPIALPGPEGFDDYTWRLNGNEVQRGRMFEHTFDTPGTFVVECVARDPEDDARWILRRVTWEITVAPRG